MKGVKLLLLLLLCPKITRCNNIKMFHSNFIELCRNCLNHFLFLFQQNDSTLFFILMRMIMKFSMVILIEILDKVNKGLIFFLFPNFNNINWNIFHIIIIMKQNKKKLIESTNAPILTHTRLMHHRYTDNHQHSSDLLIG